MSRLTRIKIGLALAGILAFGAGVRSQRALLRWAGITFVAAAFLLRFARPGGPDGPGRP